VPSNDPVTRATIARIAAHSRWRNTPDAVAHERRELDVRRVEDHIRRLVEAAPPLTLEQRDRLFVLLKGSQSRAKRS
jgi:hypothetical protein